MFSHSKPSALLNLWCVCVWVVCVCVFMCYLYVCLCRNVWWSLMFILVSPCADLNLYVCVCVCPASSSSHCELENLRHLWGLVCHIEVGSVPRPIRQTQTSSVLHNHTHTDTDNLMLYFQGLDLTAIVPKCSILTNWENSICLSLWGH